MKYNLKNIRYSADDTVYVLNFEAWLEGFEAELRERLKGSEASEVPWFREFVEEILGDA